MTVANEVPFLELTPGEMMNTTKSVSSDLTLALVNPDGGQTLVSATISYHSQDPYAVNLVFHVADDQEVEWVFSRELLFEGMSARTGFGDVQVWPEDAGTVSILLSSPSGNARFCLAVEPLVLFLTRTWALVPRGSEADHLSLDLELEDLLHGTEWRGV